MPEVSEQNPKNYEEFVYALNRAAAKLGEAASELSSSPASFEKYKSILSSINETLWKMETLDKKERGALSPEDLKKVEGLELKLEMIPPRNIDKGAQ